MKTSSQTALKVLSIIGIVVGAIIAVSGIVLTVGANGFAMSQASSSGAGVAVLGTIGGVAAVLSQDAIKSIECVEYPELGMEAIWKITVKDFPAFILVDDKGHDFFKELKPWTCGACK